jgi:hypothetical protein
MPMVPLSAAAAQSANPFVNVAYPGRDIDWKTWQAIPDEKR